LLYPGSVIFNKNAVYMAGDNLSNGFQKLKLSKFTAAGVQIYAKTFSATSTANTYFSAMQLSPSGNVYIIGKTDNAYYYLSTDNAGTKLWQHLDSAVTTGDIYAGTCLALDAAHSQTAGCGFKHYSTGEGDWVINYYTPTTFRTTTQIENSSFNSSDLNLFPNPASDIITASFEAQNFHADITDVTGRSVLAADINNGNNNINIGALPAGVYIVTVTAGDKKDFKKFIKQ